MDIRLIPIHQINPAPYNPRKDLKPGDSEYEKIKRSIEEFGYVDPCVWNERTGHLVGGHQRFKILVAGGANAVYCSVVDFELDREKALNVALNKISGEWDLPKLKDLLLTWDSDSVDITLTGFDRSEVDDLLRSLDSPKEIKEDDFDVEGERERIVDPVTQPGDLWILGRHRLLCGDATKSADVDRLMTGATARVVFTDPPYNVAYVGKTKDALRIANDSMPSEQFYEFLRDAFRNMFRVLAPGSAFYVCHADSEGINFRRALKDTGGELKQCLIWVKNAFVLGRQDYQWQHEPILYGWKKGAGHKWYGDRKESTVIDGRVPLVVTRQEDGSAVLAFQAGAQQVVIRTAQYEVVYAGDDENSSLWRFDKPLRNGDHPTMKPVGLPARALRNSSKRGDIALDQFLGGGATLIAAEQTERICYGMELDPKYCDVIVQRWEAFTGRKAVTDSGKPFSRAPGGGADS